MMQITTVDVAVDELGPGDVAIHVDLLGRVVVVIPDAAARALRQASGQVWANLPGVDYGESDRYPVGTRVQAVASALLTAVMAVTAADVPDEHLRSRLMIDAAIGALYAFVVGRSGWDPTTRWWRDNDTTTDLRVGPSLHTYVPDGSVFWAG